MWRLIFLTLWSLSYPLNAKPAAFWNDEDQNSSLKAFVAPLDFAHKAVITIIKSPLTCLMTGLSLFQNVSAITPQGWDTSFCPGKMLSPQELHNASALRQSCIEESCATFDSCDPAYLDQYYTGSGCAFSWTCNRYIENEFDGRLAIKICEKESCINRGIYYFPKIENPCTSDEDPHINDVAICLNRCGEEICEIFGLSKQCPDLSWTQRFISFFSPYCDDTTCYGQTLHWQNFLQVKRGEKQCEKRCRDICKHKKPWNGQVRGEWSSEYIPLK